MINKQKISFYFKPLKDKKKKSVYLDYAPPIPHPVKSNKKMRFQCLIEWVYTKPILPSEKQHNEDVMERCQMIKNKIKNESLKEDIYNPFELERIKIKENEEINFIDLMKEERKRKSSISNLELYASAIKLLIHFNGSDQLKLKNIDEKYIQGFREFLLNTNSLRNKEYKLSNTTAEIYLQKFKATLREAHSKHLIKYPMHTLVQSIEKDNKLPVYLTETEIQLLANNPCEDNLLYRVTLFMILTGLRISDVLKLKWKDLVHEGNKRYISIIIKKLKFPVHHHINDQAYKLMGNKTNNNDYVFDGINEVKHRRKLVNWCNILGINKDVTWHKLRHTFAVHLLDKTKDINMLKTLMHHTDLRSTMVYAHILDDKQKEAMDGFTITNL